jgi:hypothetical protein
MVYAPISGKYTYGIEANRGGRSPTLSRYKKRKKSYIGTPAKKGDEIKVITSLK